MHVGYTEPGGRVTHLGVFGHVDEIAAGCEFATACQAVSVNLRDDRLGEIPDAHPTLGDMAWPLPFTLSGEKREFVVGVAAGEVVSGGKGRAVTPHDRNLDVVVIVGIPKRTKNRASQRVNQRVAFVGSVEGNSADPGYWIVKQDPLVVRRWCATITGVARIGRLLAVVTHGLTLRGAAYSPKIERP